MASRLERLLHARRLTALLEGASGLAIARIGLRSGLLEALRSPDGDDGLAARTGFAPDLVTSWLRAAEAHALARMHDGRFELAPFGRFLLEAPEAAALHALVEQASTGWIARFDAVPALLRGADRPLYGAAAEESARMAAAWGFVEERSAQALLRIPGVRAARRVLDVGCGHGATLLRFLARSREAHGVGVERDLFVAESARRRLDEADLGRRGEIVAGDFMTLDLRRGSFDLAVLDHDLHYFPPAQHGALFRRALAHLVPGGVLAIQTPVASRDPLGHLIGGAAVAASFDLYLRCHRNLYGLPDPARLHATLREAGFGTTGESAVLPGGTVRWIWGRAGA